MPSALEWKRLAQVCLPKFVAIIPRHPKWGPTPTVYPLEHLENGVQKCLPHRDFATVQAHCARTINDLLRMDLTVHVEHDFHAFARYRRSVGDGLCNASFDPACCRINRADFWLRVVD